MKVVMIGADRSVKGGVSAVVNNLYEAGLDRRVDLTYIGTMVDGSKARKALQAALALLRFCFALPGADLIHVNMASDASCFRKLIFMRIAALFHKKILLHEHGGDFQGFYYERCGEKTRERVKKGLNLADLCLVLSEEWKEFFSAILPPEKIFVLQNGVPVPERGKSDYSGHRVLFLGRLCREKGVGELLEAAPKVRDAVPDFELVLGGFWEAGNERLKARAESLRQFVRCPGWVSPKEREKLFAECSVFVLPTWFEGQPVSLLEAMAAGLCPAVSAVGGIPQVVEGNRPAKNGGGVRGRAKESIGQLSLPRGFDGCGVLLPPKAPGVLADVLIRLLRDEGLRKRGGERGRQRIMQGYDIKNTADRLVVFYERVCKKEGI